MAAPASDSSEDQQPRNTAAETAVIALLAAYFGSRQAVNATLLPANLVAALTGLGLSQRAAVAAGRLALAPPLTGRGRHGSPKASDTTTSMARKVAAEEPQLRAQYLLDAAKRLSKALLAGGSGLFPAAIRNETRYMAQQRAAGQNRRKAAAALDRVAADAGPNGKWRWNTQQDGRVTPDCRARSGHIYNVGETADGLIPGAAHPTCRCYPTVATDMFSPLRQLFAVQ